MNGELEPERTGGVIHASEEEEGRRRTLCTHRYDAFRRGYAPRKRERVTLSRRGTRGFVYKQNGRREELAGTAMETARPGMGRYRFCG